MNKDFWPKFIVYLACSIVYYLCDLDIRIFLFVSFAFLFLILKGIGEAIIKALKGGRK